jgi:hypothetical protein
MSEYNEAPFNIDDPIPTLDPAPEHEPSTLDGTYVRELDQKATAEAVRKYKEGPAPVEEGEF